MATRIRKCANPRCSDIVGTTERPNKKFCSVECKTQAHNDNNKKGLITWDKILDKYYSQEKSEFTSLDKWLKENYYPPRIIKQKKITL